MRNTCVIPLKHVLQLDLSAIAEFLFYRHDSVMIRNYSAGMCDLIGDETCLCALRILTDGSNKQLYAANQFFYILGEQVL